MNRWLDDIKETYQETELPCSISGLRKWIDNYGYTWFTDEKLSYKGETEQEATA